MNKLAADSSEQRPGTTPADEPAESRASGRRGRRPGRPETRAQLLDIARRRFLEAGYQAVTLRSVAAEAGVDVALVSYFFGSKKGLFGAALALPANPPEVLVSALQGDPATLPERVLRVLLHVWDDHAQERRVGKEWRFRWSPYH